MRHFFEGASLPSGPSVPMDDMNDRLQGFCRFRVRFRIHKHGAPTRLTRRPVAWPQAGVPESVAARHRNRLRRE